MNKSNPNMPTIATPATVFISYCHDDGTIVGDLLKFLDPLEKNGMAEVWSDRRIPAGEALERKIEEKLHTADIVVFCLSPHFMNSSACMDEFKTSCARADRGDAKTISFVLSECRWKDISEIRKNKVLPIDGKSVLSFSDQGTAFNQLFEQLRVDLALVARKRNLSFSNKFIEEIQQIGLLGGFRKDNEVSLFDIYVDPVLHDESIKREKNDNRYLSSALLPDVVERKKRVVISGPAQSGKTSMCRVLCKRLFEKGFIPVFLSGDSHYQGIFDDLVNDALKRQYSDPEVIRKERIVLILDDYDHANKADKVLLDLSRYDRCVLIVGDLYEMDFRNQSFLKEFTAFAIIPFGARKRSELVGKWLGVESTGLGDAARRGIEKLDETNEMVTSMLGKVLGKGIMPSFPFFILLIVATFENNQSFGDREITSQGHCYFVLLFVALTHNGVKNNQIDTYLNFLSELSIAMFRNNDELDEDAFKKFIAAYKNSFNLPIHQEAIMNVLNSAGIVFKNGFGYYRFNYRYLYFYFVAKYFSDHEQECDHEIKEMLNELGESRNAYIAVFLTHHSKSEKAFDEILEVAKTCLPDVRQPSLLFKEDLSFFDGHVKRIAQASLNAWNDSPAQARERQLEIQEKNEESVKESHASESKMVRDFVLAWRTADVLGQAIKNRAGSLKKKRLKNVIQTILDIHAKIYSQFFSLLQMEGMEEGMVEMLAYWLSKHPKIVSRLPEEKIKELASSLFWNLNYRVICGITMHCVRSIGSDQLWPVVKEVCECLSVPLNKVIKLGTEIYYKNRVPVSALKKEKDKLPIVVWSVVREMVVQYCNTHPMKFDERQQVESLFETKNTLIKYQQRK